MVESYQVAEKRKTESMLSRLERKPLLVDRGVAVDLVLVFLAALGVRLCWAAITPPWLSPDEPSHFSYVAHLVENEEIPQPFVHDPRYPGHSREYQRSCELTFCSKLSGQGSRAIQMKSLPLEYDYERARAHRLDGELRKTAAGSSASEYPPLYYAIATLPYQVFYHHPILARVFGVRATSAWLSALACVFGYLFAFEVQQSRLWGRATALSLAFMPMYAFIGGSINNDAAMYASTAALWWLLARTWLASELQLKSAFALGAIAGVSMLAKPTSAPLAIPAALLVAVKALRGANGWRFQPRAAAAIALFGVGFLLFEGPWYLYRATHTLSAPASGPPRPSAWRTLLGQAQYSLGDYLQELWARGSTHLEWIFVKTFWAGFGWLEIYLPEAAYTILKMALGALALGVLVRLWVKPAERAVLVSLLAVIVFNAAALFLAADFIMAFAHRGSLYGMQGRYFFGALVPLMVVLISGLCGILGERAWVLRIAPLLMVVLHIVSVLTVLRSYYGITVG